VADSLKELYKNISKMKPDNSQIQKIRTMFDAMQTREDLLDILNAAKRMVMGEETEPFTISSLTYLSNPNRTDSQYVRFEVKKKSGAVRQLHAPKAGLKSIQRALSFVLQCVYEPHAAATGFVWDRSIVENAKRHLGQRYVYNIDLKDFFESIDQARVWKCLQHPPFNLNLSTTADVELLNWKEQFQEPFKNEVKLKLGLPPTFKAVNSGKYRRITFNGKKYYIADMPSVGPLINIAIENNKNLKFTVERIPFMEYCNERGFKEVSAAVKVSKKGEPLIIFYGKKGEEAPIKFAPKASETVEKNAAVLKLHNDLVVAVYVNAEGERAYYLEWVSQPEEIIHPEFFKDFWMVNRDPDFTRLNIAGMIAGLCFKSMEVERKNDMYQWEKVKRNVLPQGAPTSPVLTNIVCQKLDFLLTGVAKRFGLKYSRYADDITFSSMHNVYQPESEFLKELHRIITEQNFHIKESKTRLQKDGHRKEVTGLLVNEQVNVQKRYIKQLRMWLYYWEKYGYERASGFFLQQYTADKGHVMKGKPDMANVISGKLDYLKMVKGADNELYLNLKRRLGGLTNSKDPIDQVLFTWESEGIDKAIDIYYKGKLQ
jgi:retron-type reverse transcriptase